jgi:hypothetical protein
MFHNKTNFGAALSEQFRTSALWRKAQAKRFKYDARNAEASQRLLELESQIVIPDDVWEKIKPLVSDPNRDVGFRKHPADFADWLEDLHANLALHSVAA